jgi:phage terminase large subunit-like protein
MALRLTGLKGDAPRVLVSTTPKRHSLLRQILIAASTIVTRSRTTDNAANLDATTLDYLKQRYGGTTLGRQELDAELLDDVEGALWNRAMLDACRVKEYPEMRRIVVGIDPACSLRLTRRGSDRYIEKVLAPLFPTDCAALLVAAQRVIGIIPAVPRNEDRAIYARQIADRWLAIIKAEPNHRYELERSLADLY